MPKQTAEDDQERLDAHFIMHAKQAKYGKFGYVWYPGIEEIAKQYGFPDAFESQLLGPKLLSPAKPRPKL